MKIHWGIENSISIGDKERSDPIKSRFRFIFMFPSYLDSIRIVSSAIELDDPNSLKTWVVDQRKKGTGDDVTATGDTFKAERMAAGNLVIFPQTSWKFQPYPLKLAGFVFL